MEVSDFTSFFKKYLISPFTYFTQILNENPNELSFYFSDREDITSEHVLEVLYLEQKAAPEPQDSVNHDDWVSGVDIHSGLILSCSYDNTVCLWDAKDGTKKLQIPGHVGPARAVAFINVDEDKNAVFASASYDQTVVLYKYCNQTNSIEGMNVGKGKKTYVLLFTYFLEVTIWGEKLIYLSLLKVKQFTIQNFPCQSFSMWMLL